ncbi:MAG: endonuclease domain-containing protein [Cocleimonas sp.]
MKSKSRALRRDQTDAEKELWKLLRGKKLSGHKFRRQHPFPPYIVDFVCLKSKLIIEVDGSQHAEAVDYDNKRTVYLESQGFTVIRFWNNEIMTNKEGVYEVISKHLKVPSTQWEEG